MVSVQELYELWASEATRNSRRRSREPRRRAARSGSSRLFASLEPKPGELVLDVGARDAIGAITLARTHELRAVALDPVPLALRACAPSGRRSRARDRIEVVEGAIEEIPLDDASVDWIWCRDILVHVELGAASRSARASFEPGGRDGRVRHARDRAARAARAAEIGSRAIVPENFDGRRVEAAAAEAGCRSHA